MQYRKVAFFNHCLLANSTNLHSLKFHFVLFPFLKFKVATKYISILFFFNSLLHIFLDYACFS